MHNYTATLIYVTTQFVGFHRYKDAPEDVKFLREWHRHVFHVKLAVEVKHDNRQVEFFQLKCKLNRYLEQFRNQFFEYSCEQLAGMIVDSFEGVWVECSEDLENGAIVQR